MKPLRILMLEDNPLDAAVIQKTLSNSLDDYTCIVANNGEDYKDLLNREAFDVILCDYQLPGFDAVKALHIRNQRNSAIPFILVTGAVSEEIAINLIKEGANDYILKDRLQRLPVAIEKAVKKEQLKWDRQSLEQSLSQLTERFQLAAKTSFDVIWDYDIEKDLLYCSPVIEKIIGTAFNDKLGLPFFKTFIHPDDLAAIEQSFIGIMKSTENRWRKIFRLVRKNGSIAWVNTNAMILRSKNETAIRIVGVMHDITEVRELQHQLVDCEMQNQKQIATITLQAQEKERMEIGKELHDNVNQLLATSKIMIDTARNFPDMHDLCLAKSQESILEAIQELRNLAHAMLPPPFENNNFENILHDLASKINLTRKLNVQLFLPSKTELDLLNNEIKLALYRIIQEQLSNILKHAQARNTSIAIELDGANVTLTVEDDGIGFNPQKRSKGIGLKNIESRCNLLSGTLNLISSIGKGCAIRVQLPVKSTVYV